MMLKHVLLFFFVVYGCTGCGSDPVRTPISQIDIPTLDSDESRVFFYRTHTVRNLHPVIISTNGTDYVTLNAALDCTYVDFTPGDYTFVADNSRGFMFRDAQYDLSLEPGETNYLQWNYEARNFTRESGRFVHLTPEQGVKEIAACFFVKSDDNRS